MTERDPDFEPRQVRNPQERGRWQPLRVLRRLTLIAALFLPSAATAATITTAGSGNWNSAVANAPWPGGTVPATTDDVVIRAGDSITVTADATINSVVFNNASSTVATLTVNSGVILTVTAGVTLQNSATIATAATIAGAGTLSCASVSVGGTTAPTATSTIGCALTSTISTLSISGNLTARSQRPSGSIVNNATFALGSGSISVGGSVVLNADTTATATLTLATGAQTGTLALSGATPFSSPGAGTATFSPNGTSATVVYSGAAQTVKAVAYYHLTLSGSAAKTLTGVTSINGNLSLSGTATATTAAALTIGGNLTVGSGTTFTVAGFNIAVTGTTSVTGTLTHSSATGTKTYTGSVTINSGGIWNETAAAAISFAGNLQNDGTLTASTGVHTFTGTAMTLSGANTISIPSVTVSGTYQNNGTLTVNTALAGTGTLTQGASATLNLGGTSAITGLTATASPNTVNYTGAAQTVKAVAYYHLTLSGSAAKTLTGVTTINGNLSLSGTATATTAAALTVGGNLTVGSGTTFTVAGFNIAVTGTTSVTGTLKHSSATGTKTYTGSVTINSGGIWNETAAAAISFAGNLQNDGTLTASTGVHTFTGTAMTLSGANTISIPSVTVSGTYQNNGTLTVNTALAGTGTLTQGASATLNLGGTSAITGLTATASPNTVNYTGAAQTVKAVAYYHLTLSGSAAKTLTGVTTINGNLSLSGTATATTAAALTVGGNLTVGSGTTFTVAGFNIAVTGTTSVTGTLKHSSATGTKTYTGSVTINSGGIWNETAAAAISFAGNLQNDGTLTASTGVHTFTGTAMTLSGANTISIPSVTVSGTYQNNGTLTVNTALAGTGTLTQGASATLNLGGTSAITGLTATASPNTVNYTGAAQTVKAVAYYHLTLSGSAAKTLTGVTTINGNLTISGSATMTGNTSFTLGGAFTYSSSGSTTLTPVTPISMGAFSQSLGTLVDSGNTITVTGTGASTWSKSGGTFTATGTAKFTGAAPQISSFTFNNLEINVGAANSATLTGSVTATGTLTLTDGTLSNSGNLTLGNGATISRATGALAAPPTFGTTVNVTYTGSTGVTSANELPSSTSVLNNLTLNYSSSATLTLSAACSVNGLLNIGANSTLGDAGMTLTVKGNVLNGGTHSGTGKALLTGGSGAHVMSGTGVFGNLELNDSNGATLSGSPTINSTVTLTTGKITTGANTLIIGTNGSINGASSTTYVVGNLRKMFAVGSPLLFTFPVGDASNYTPVDLANLNVTTAGYATASTIGGAEHPDIANSGLNANHDINRYWTLAGAGGLVVANYDATFHFVVGDLDAGADFNKFVVRKFDTGSSTWSAPSTGTPTSTSAQATGLSSFGDFAIGERQIDHYTLSVTSPQKVGVAFPTTVTAQDKFNQTVPNSSTVVTMSSSGSVQFDGDGNGIFGDNTKTLTAGLFSITTKDNVAEAVILTATDGNGKAGNSPSITVNPGDQNITFTSPSDQIYGVAPITLTATASSGLTVSYTVTSGPATVVGNSLSITGAGSVTIQASQGGNANWNAATPISRTVFVAQKSLTPSVTANSKTYDGTTAAAIASRTLSGVVGSDVVSLSGGTATFADPNMGAGKTVTVTGLSLSGAGAGNYSLVSTTATTTANITAAAVSISSGLTANNKTYDGTTTATVISNTVVLAGVLAGDAANVSLSTNGYTATFGSAVVGTSKTVTVSSLTLTGGAAANYSLTQPSLSANITPKALTAQGTLSGGGKAYDGLTTATPTGSAALQTAEATGSGTTSDGKPYTGDTVSLTGTASYAFNSKDVATATTITGSGLSLTGAQAGDYTLTQPSLTANITAATVTVTLGITANNKAYDGTTTATIVSNNVVLAGVLAGDAANVSLSTNGYSATFATAAVSNGKAVTVSGLTLAGSAASNYTLTQPSLSANITPGTFSQLAFTTQPGSATAGAPFGQQPVVQTQDAYGNASRVGLGAHLAVAVTLTSGTGPLQGTATLDIGTSAGNGTASFINLRIDPAGTKQLTASASGLTAAVSAPFSIANVPPVAGTATFLRPRNVPLKILISGLLTNASDLNGDTRLLAAVSDGSTNGAALYTNATYVLYSLPPGGNVSDSFIYTVSDGTATTAGTVLINIATDSTGTNYNQVACALVNGKPTSTFAGAPGYTYKVQRTQDLTGNPIWTDLATTNAPARGLFQFVDQNPPNGNLIYRAINQ